MGATQRYRGVMVGVLAVAVLFGQGLVVADGSGATSDPPVYQVDWTGAGTQEFITLQVTDTGCMGTIHGTIGFEANENNTVRFLHFEETGEPCVFGVTHGELTGRALEDRLGLSLEPHHSVTRS